MLSPKIIFLKTAPPPPEIELLLFDAESENHIPENSPPPIPENSPPPPEIELLLFDAESENHIPENSPPPKPEIELLLFDAESENHIPENSPPPQKLNFYFLMLSPKIIFLKTAPPPVS